MKKILNAFLSLVLMSCLAGCSQKTTAHYVQDGIFEGTAEGYGGDIDVSVEFSGDTISEVKITKQNESGVIADDALKKIPTYIKNEQSVNVDVSTGATVTSRAVMAAVSDAIGKAHGNVNDWNKDATGINKTKEESLNTTVVVVGGGVSGIAAALRLEQLGIKTMIVEKSGSLGGSLKLSDDETQLAVTNEELADSTMEIESPADLYQDVYAYGDNAGTENLLHLLFTNLIKTTEWQENDLGLSFLDRVNTDGYSGKALAVYDSDDAAPGELLAREADICGADIMMNTAAVGLIHDGNKVTGITAKASNGRYYTINADYVILAAGSTGVCDDVLYYGNDENTGDLITMADNDSSLKSTDGSDQIFETGVQLDDQHAVDAVSSMQAAMEEGLLLVNQNGDRFTDESASAYDLSRAIDEQPDKKAYLIMNVGAYRTFRRQLLRNGVISDDMAEEIEDDESDFNEQFYCQDIRDVSSKFNIDQTVLLNTILSFNDDSSAKKDSLFSRTAFNRKIDVGNELMVVPLVSYKTLNLGGLVVDDSLHVIDDAGSAVNNVYCIGSAVGGVFGTKAAPGAMNTWAFVSAKAAADAIAEEAGR